MKWKVSEIKENPKNPRVIRDEQFKKLVKSIKEFPEMLAVRKLVVTPDLVVLGGNMRLKALKEAGITEVDVDIVDWDEDKQNRFIIADNVSFGDWNHEVLANEWEATDLLDWGVPNVQWDTEDITFAPNLQPIVNHGLVTEKQLEQAEQKLANRMKIPYFREEVICPECNAEFELARYS